MKNKLSIFIVLLFLVAGFFLINYDSKVFEIKDVKQVQIANKNIKVSLALTEAEHIKGLSGKDKLEDDEGMLFVFDQIGKHNFWMKGMNFPIDIIWLGEDMKVVYIKENANPKKFPETFGPETFSKYVLEVVAGFSNKNGLKVGDEVLFTY